MAVRFDLDTEDYTRTISLGTITQFSVSCWVKLSVDRDTYSTAWCIDSGATTDYSYLQTTTDGTAMAFYQDGASALGPRALNPGTWYWWGVAVNGVNVTVMSRAVGDATSIVSTSGVGSSNTSAVNLRLGESVFGGEWLNGCLAAVKIWNGVTLTQAELEAEAFRYTPARTAGLLGWYPLLMPEGVDYSGAGSTLSGGTGTVVEDGPPISWGPRNKRIYIPPAATLKSLADAGSAVEQLAVSAAVALSQAGSGADAVSASVAVPVADAGSGGQALAAAAAAPLTDSASSSESMVAGVPKSAADVAGAADVLAVATSAPLSQVGAAADAVTATAVVGLPQAASGVDSLAGGPLLVKAFGDAASASESLSAAVAREIVGARPPYTAWSAGPPESRRSAGSPLHAWSAAAPSTDWAARSPMTRYAAGPPSTKEV